MEAIARRLGFRTSAHAFYCTLPVMAPSGSKANFRYVSLNISENAFEVLPEVVADDVTSGFALSLSTNERFRNFASALDE